MTPHSPPAAATPLAAATDPEPPEERRPFDVLTMGRIGVDIYPLRTGLSLTEVETFGKFLGGSPTNVAVGAARLGRRTALISRTGKDPFGAYCRKALAEFGVDTRWVTEVAEYPTPVTFCEIFPPDDFPLYFYRLPKAPDLEIHDRELDRAALRSAGVFWMTGTGLCAEPSRTATLKALEERRAARPGQTATVFDLDWRPMFWDGGPDKARVHYEHALPHATVAVGNVEECAVVTGVRDPRACARALLARGVRLAVVKRGPDGVLAMRRDGRTVEVPPHPVQVVNGLGAGDAFGAALCHGLLAGWGLERMIRFANAAGALVAGRLSCSAAMPTEAEVEQLLAGGTDPAPAAPAGDRADDAADASDDAADGTSDDTSTKAGNG